ncbi:MAG: phage tail assembly chaperone [Rhizobiaceae bacterium]
MAAGLGLLGIQPNVFWTMTPREIEAALSVLAPAAIAPPGRDALAAMMGRFPDKTHEEK